MHEVQYFHGQKHGIEKWFYENGNIKSLTEKLTTMKWVIIIEITKKMIC